MTTENHCHCVETQEEELYPRLLEIIADHDDRLLRVPKIGQDFSIIFRVGFGKVHEFVGRDQFKNNRIG